MRARALVVGWAIVAAAAAARAEGDDESGEAGEDEEDQVVVPDDKPKPKPAVKVKPGEPTEFKKQDLRGHAVDESDSTNVFLKDRFFADKVDTAKTAKGTLVQGSISTAAFAYTESSDDLGTGFGDSASKFSRMFGELRLQTDFRHIGGGRWDARVDARVRGVTTPGETSRSSDDANRIQSGYNGTNELDMREAWLVRSGERSDVFIGRQFIADLGALKIDGVRVDYAKSEKLTFVSFAGLYPLRSSRSLTTDYIALKDNQLNPAGRFVGAGGFGAAYRTLKAHGAFGGVALVPFSSEAPRIYATSNGYLRTGRTLDFYHYAIVDVLGSAAVALTNLSLGANFKPAQRLRLTASFNRVDTETLNVQANAFLSNAEAPGDKVSDRVQNETFIRRLSTNIARGSVSAALGNMQRFEVTIATAFRYRPEVSLLAADNMTRVDLDAAKGIDVYGSITDRRSFAHLRLGLDGSRTFAVGNQAFQRTEVLAVRAFGAREIQGGKGEIEAEVSYATARDRAGGTDCVPMPGPNPDTPIPVDATQCFGTSKSKILSFGGNVFYRLTPNWLGLASLFVSRQATERLPEPDPTILGLTGFFRIHYRF